MGEAAWGCFRFPLLATCSQCETQRARPRCEEWLCSLCLPLLGLASSNTEGSSLLVLAAKHLATQLGGLLERGHRCTSVLNCIPGFILFFLSHFLSHPTPHLLAFKSCYDLSALQVTANPVWNEGEYTGINNYLDPTAGGMMFLEMIPRLHQRQENLEAGWSGDGCENELHFRRESAARPCRYALPQRCVPASLALRGLWNKESWP